MKRSLVVMVAGIFLLVATFAFAAAPKTYQVTGPVLELKDDMIVVQKGKDRWEIARGAAAPSIDTGMGLERITAVRQGVLSNYDIDSFKTLLAAIGERAGTVHRGTMEPSDVSMRVVADHLRAMTFLIADGVVPSNEWRGYVLRKIMRRAMRHGQKLGIEGAFLHELTHDVVARMKAAYPELVSHEEAVSRVVAVEEERFGTTLKQAFAIFKDIDGNQFVLSPK